MNESIRYCTPLMKYALHVALEEIYVRCTVYNGLELENSNDIACYIGWCVAQAFLQLSDFPESKHFKSLSACILYRRASILAVLSSKVSSTSTNELD